MMNIIKTALVTITISIISGLLLEHFKNLAPRILCEIEKGKSTEIYNKKIYAYVITVSNMSKKIIHELALNVQSPKGNLEISDAKITKGLKFDSLVKDNVLDIDIPFLSKGDKFSVVVYVESCTMPVIVMRSPENFKRVDSLEENDSMVSNQNNDYTIIMDKVPDYKKSANKKNREKLYKNKKTDNKAMILVVLLILVVAIAGVMKFYFKGTSGSTQSPSIKTDVNKNSKSVAKPKDKTTKNESTNSSSGTAKNVDTKAATDQSDKNTDTSTPSGETAKSADTKTPTGTTDTNTSTDGTAKDTDTKSSTNTNTNTAKDGTSNTTDTNTSAGETTENPGN